MCSSERSESKSATKTKHIKHVAQQHGEGENGTTDIEPVEQIVARLFVIEEHLKVLKHTLVDGHRVEVADGIFSEEVELNDVLFAIFLLVQLHVFEAQRAASHRVSNLVSVLLVTSSQRQLQTTNSVQSSHKKTRLEQRSDAHLVDEVHSDGALSDAHLLALHVVAVARANLVDFGVELARNFVLLPVLLALQLRVGRKHDVLVLVLHVLNPTCQPTHSVVVTYLLPLVP